MTHADIIASLQQFWSDNGPQSAPTIFAGAPIAVTSDPMWMEFWVTEIAEPAKRPAGPLRQTLSIDLHLFSKSDLKREINSLADAAGSVLRSAIVPVLSGGQSVGTLRIEEPALRDISRPKLSGSATGIQHWLITARAVAQESI